MPHTRDIQEFQHLSHALMPTVIIGPDLSVIHISETYRSLTALTEEWLGRSIYDVPTFQPPVVEQDILRRAVADATSTRTAQIIEVTHYNNCSTTHDIKVTPVFEGAQLRYITFVTQCSHEPQAPCMTSRDDTAYSDKEYQMLVNNITDHAIFTLNRRGHVATWNPGAVLLKGYRPEEIIGRHFSVFYSDEDRMRDKPGKELEYCLREGRVEDEGWRYRKDGSRFWANVIMSPIYRSGCHIGFAKVTRDLTERKASESRLIRAVEESSTLKSEFLANVSHEIRTPMHGMLVALTMLLETGLDEKQREYASVIESSGAVLLRIMNDILDSAKLSSGTLSVSPGSVDTADVITNVINKWKGSLKASVTMESWIQPGLPRRFEGDSVRYQQIINNMVENAVKFTESGHIAVRTTFKQVRNDETSFDISTDVIDTGIGVAPGNVSLLFEPFNRFASTSHKQYQGTGLGLSICKSLAELMNGTVGFRPNPGSSGSIFWVTVRLREEIDHAESGVKPPLEIRHCNPEGELKAIASRKHLLLVEDNKINQAIMLKLLGLLGFEKIDTAFDGAEAVQLVKRKPFSYSVVLMDINMPVMTGVEATLAIRLINREVPIIAVTGNALKGDSDIYFATGMNDCVSKPINRRLLVGTLLRWIGR